jgi:hypothetical protein
LSKLVKAAAESIESGDAKLTGEIVTAMANFSPGFKIAQASNDAGMTRLGKDTRWWSENGDLVTWCRRYNNPLRRLLELEVAADSDIWIAAIEYYRSLMMVALQDLDFNEVLENTEALISIYGKDPVFSSALESAKELKRLCTIMTPSWDAIRSGRSAKGPVDGVLQIVCFLWIRRRMYFMNKGVRRTSSSLFVVFNTSGRRKLLESKNSSSRYATGKLG